MKSPLPELSNDFVTRPSLRGWPIWLAGAVAVLAIWTFRPNQPLQSGVVSSVLWMEGSNRGQFLTRGPSSLSVPNGNGGGSMTVSMLGSLYPTHLELKIGSRGIIKVIPMSQLVSVEFGNGGIVDGAMKVQDTLIPIQ